VGRAIAPGLSDSYHWGMRWLVSGLVAAALVLSAYAVYKAKKVESAAKPQVRLITAQVR